MRFPATINLKRHPKRLDLDFPPDAIFETATTPAPAILGALYCHCALSESISNIY
jgi:hypothetical protein